MARFGSVQFAFPDFSGATRRILLWNLGAFFVLLLATAARLVDPVSVAAHLGMYPPNFAAGQVWQPLTYSLIHFGILGTAFELLSIWFLAGFLQSMHPDRWVMGLYIWSVIGAGLTSVLIYALGQGLGYPQPLVAITGSLGGIFGLLTAIAVLHGDVQFQMMFVIGIKAKYLAIIYTLIALAETFGEQRIYAFAQLGGAVAAILYVRFATRKGVSFAVSEGFYGLRNKYYRWKRRRAASKFQVYMKKQGRSVRFDGQGRLIDEDDKRHDDRQRWN